VARCSLEDVQPFRILEVPLWMLDTAVCCKIRTAKAGVANAASLRELITLLRSAQRKDLDLAIQAQHRYLLNAGGADVGIAESTEIRSTGVVWSATSETGLAGAVTRNSREGFAIAEPTAEATERKIERPSGRKGGSR
jgi:hypothetical protein